MQLYNCPKAEQKVDTVKYSTGLSVPLSDPVTPHVSVVFILGKMFHLAHLAVECNKQASFTSLSFLLVSAFNKYNIWFTWPSSFICRHGYNLWLPRQEIRIFLGEELLYHLGHGFDTLLYWMFKLFMKMFYTFLYITKEKKTPTQKW